MPLVPSLAGQILDDVYVIEVSSPPTIQGVQVGVVGLVGTFQQGIAGAIYSISDYPTAVRLLGKSTLDVGGPIAIQNLLRQQCGNIQVVPVFGDGADAASVSVIDAQATPGVLGTITAAQPHPQTGVMTPLLGSGPNAWSVTITEPSTPNGTFNLTINALGAVEQYSNLTPANWAATVNASSSIAIVTQPESPSSNVPATGTVAFSGGSSGTLDGGALDSAIIGSVGAGGEATGIYLLGTLAPNAINLVFAAEASSTAINSALATLANGIDCIALVCAPSGQTVSQTQAAQGAIAQDNVVFTDGWSTCYDADLATSRTCAPTALVAGMVSQLPPQYSWGNKQIYGTQGLAVSRSRADLETLQRSGILCLANQIPRGGFGTRSGVASDGSDVYVRRMRYFLEFSIMQSMGWAVDALQSTSATDPLRRNVTQSLSTFLNGLAYPVDERLKTIDSYTVTCNLTNNPPSQIAAGILSVNVVVRLLAAAKQIVIACDISTSAVTTSSTVGTAA
jgi:hypothetical protein